MTTQLILDLDGTLVDTSARYHAVYRHVLAGEGCTALAADEFWAMKREGLSNDEVLRRSRCALSADAYTARFIELIELPEYLLLDRPIPGVAEALARLARGHRLSLATLRRDRRMLLEQLRRLKLEGHFERVANDREPAARDPSDDHETGAFSHRQRKVALLRELGVSAGVVIGDSEADIMAGRDSGLATIGVLSGIRSRGALEACEPDAVVEDVTHIDNRLLEGLAVC